MIEWLIGILVAYWHTNRGKQKANLSLQNNELMATNDHKKIPFGYLKDDETIGDLI